MTIGSIVAPRRARGLAHSAFVPTVVAVESSTVRARAGSISPASRARGFNSATRVAFCAMSGVFKSLRRMVSWSRSQEEVPQLPKEAHDQPDSQGQIFSPLREIC